MEHAVSPHLRNRPATTISIYLKRRYFCTKMDFHFKVNDLCVDVQKQNLLLKIFFRGLGWQHRQPVSLTSFLLRKPLTYFCKFC